MGQLKTCINGSQLQYTSESPGELLKEIAGAPPPEFLI